MVTDTVWPLEKGPQVGASGRFCPQYPSPGLPSYRYTWSWAQGTSRSEAAVIGTEKRPEPRATKYCDPLRVSGMTLPGAGVGMLTMRLLTRSGEEDDSHALTTRAARSSATGLNRNS